VSRVSAEPGCIPAIRWRVFSRAYDPVLALTMREGRFRAEMRERVEDALPRGGIVLDIGCDTGTFAIVLARRRPDARVIGIDGDAEILARAKAKPDAAAVEWQEGLAGELPFADESVDVVTMSLVLHHLLPGQKREAGFREVERYDRLRTAFGSLDLLAAGR
jgi:ubiquinone/menaquinone biosynthesis C-methylase UbiE